MSRRKVRTHRRTVLLDRPNMRVVEEEFTIAGKRMTYRHRVQGPVVAIVALTKRGGLVLVRQYRPPVRKWLLEIPAGTVEPGEPLLAAAKRELLEETGFTAKTWRKAGAWYPAPAGSTVLKHVYLALGAVRTRRPRLDATEVLHAVVLPVDRLWQQFHRLPAKAEGLLVGIALAARYHRGIR